MVYQDISEAKLDPSRFHQDSQKSSYFQVSVLDRFFSFLIDYLVLSPFVSFFLLLFFKDSISYWRTNPSAPEQNALTLILAISYVVLFSSMQAFFIWRWQATPGQYFLKIKIYFEGENTFIFWRALLRQLGFWASFLLLGLPWLALLSHSKQKPFYDRLSDSQVFSKKESSTFLSFEIENKYWQSFLATLMIFLGFILFSVFWFKYDEVKQRVASFKQFEKDHFFCAEIKNVSESSRLQLALALNLVGQLSDDCLDKEADFVLWKQKTDEIDLAYYAKSLTEEDADVEQKYLHQACEKTATRSSSLGCQLADSFLTGDFEKLYTSLKKNKSLLARSLTYEFGLILNKTEDQKNNFLKLADFDTHRLIKKYLLSEMILQKKSNDQRAPASTEEDDEMALKWVEEL